MSALPRAGTGARRIMIVDDDRDFAESLAILLGIEGYEVRRAHDGAAALSMLDTYDAEMALVDLRLGSDDGIGIVRALKERRADLACVVVTAHASAETAIDALQGGLSDYLCKPFRPSEVAAVIERCLRQVDLEHEKARAEAALRASEARFRDFAETAADWFWETDDAGHFIYVSGRYEDLTGVSPAEMIGFTLTQFLAGRGQDVAPLEPLVSVVAAREPFDGFVFETVCGDGGVAVHSLSGRPFFDRCGAFLGHRGTGRDITEEDALSRELHFHAAHDALTGLVNRREFELRLGRVLETTRHAPGEHALLYLDLDQFKVVNDSSGHVAGDELLRQLATLLAGIVRKSDTFARLGGDEFGVLLEHCSIRQAERIATGLRKAVEDFRFVWESRTFGLGVSIGLVPITGAAHTATDVLKDADNACYLAKERGRNRVHVHHPEDGDLARRRGEMQWVARITETLEQERLALCFQRIEPIAPADPVLTRGIELLLRMVEEDGTIVLPGAFLPAAERYNVVSRVDRWVLDSALSALEGVAWDARALCFINLSGHTVGDAAFLDHATGRLRESTFPPESLCFEITETAAISNLAAARRLMSTLKGVGCRFALDDFGSGVSSFSYLKNLPVDYVKIDGAFVRGIEENPVDLAMVRSIHEIGQLMGKQTIAECVESPAALEALRELGVDYAQGFAIHRPEAIAGLGQMFPVRPPGLPGG